VCTESIHSVQIFISFTSIIRKSDKFFEQNEKKRKETDLQTLVSSQSKWLWGEEVWWDSHGDILRKQTVLLENGKEELL